MKGKLPLGGLYGKNGDEENCIQNNKMLSFGNKELSDYNYPKMIEKELKDILEEMECVEGREMNKSWIQEWIKVTYK
ncbi:hypothetical protein X928_04805 [Petrotoga miotherma DSM 10691]|jgi:hypothetical protein|uniref:Uncharacterized protein n=1 Tax=Petrotoga miotherma DSM 10691 TaxID=1434326 RepID=A0A2K1PCU9_9BACT|nr:hypothetical protein [Petrotoga miotherma]PNS00590.1 hypothetical protein X928_04805 [Petrotoga miotherma DSM 10691]